MEITKLPVGKQLIEALTTGPSNAPHVLYAWSNACMLPITSFQIKLCLTSTTCACPYYHHIHPFEAIFEVGTVFPFFTVDRI